MRLAVLGVVEFSFTPIQKPCPPGTALVLTTRTSVLNL